MNTIGTLFRFTDFGESHGAAIGGVIDGIVPGFEIDNEALTEFLRRRRPGAAGAATSRAESDVPVFLSGIFDGKTLGTPIAFTIANSDTRSSDYDNLRDLFRPNHADYTYFAKYGIRDHRGGGRASARETAARAVAGGIAKQILESYGIGLTAYTRAIGGIECRHDSDLGRAVSSPLFCPDADAERLMIEALDKARSDGDTLGGVVGCRISGLPAGMGEPVFGKFQAMLAAAMMSINAAKGFDYGDGFDAASMRGSESIDIFVPDGNDRAACITNHSGGIQGGITNGMDVDFRVAFKPIATMPRPIPTVDTKMNPTTVCARGRHDVCALPRAVAVVEAMAAITILDAFLIFRARQ